MLRGGILTRALFFVISGGLLWLLLELSNATDLVENSMGIFSSMPVVILFSCFLMSSALLGVGESSMNISVEDEWLATIYPTHTTPPLHSKLKKVRLGCQVFSPLFVAPLFFLPTTWATFIVVLVITFALVPEYMLLRYTYSKRVELSESRDESQWVARDLYPGNPLTSIWRYWRRLKAQVLFLIIIANFLMSFWYLSLDMPLFLSYLAVESLNPMWIGVFRSAVAVVDVVCINNHVYNNYSNDIISDYCSYYSIYNN